MNRANFRGAPPKGGHGVPTRGTWQQMGGTISMSSQYGDGGWNQGPPVSTHLGPFATPGGWPSQDATYPSANGVEPHPWTAGTDASPGAQLASLSAEQRELDRLRREVAHYHRIFGEGSRGPDVPQPATTQTLTDHFQGLVPSASSMHTDDDVIMEDSTTSSETYSHREQLTHARGRWPYRGGRDTHRRARSHTPYSRPYDDDASHHRAPLGNSQTTPPMGPLPRSSSFSQPRRFAPGGKGIGRNNRGRYGNMSYYRQSNGDDQSIVTEESRTTHMKFNIKLDVKRVRALMRQAPHEWMHTAIWKLDEAIAAARAKDHAQRSDADKFVLEQWTERARPEWYRVERSAHRKELKDRGYIAVRPTHRQPVDDWYVYYLNDATAECPGLRRHRDGRPDVGVLEGLYMAHRIAEPSTPERAAHTAAIIRQLALTLQSPSGYVGKVEGQNLAIVETFNIVSYSGAMPPTENDLVKHLASCGITELDARLIFRNWACYWAKHVDDDVSAGNEALVAQPVPVTEDEGPSSGPIPASGAVDGGKINEQSAKPPLRPLAMDSGALMEVDHATDSGAVSA